MDNPIQEAFRFGFADCLKQYSMTPDQMKAGYAILNCRTGALGCNAYFCPECGHIEIHNNSCRNRNCPVCQGVEREIWIDKRSSELFHAPYFHVVCTLPAELAPLLLRNQKALYNLFHKSVGNAILKLSADNRYLGAVPSILQVLHTFGSRMSYHVHLHVIVSGGGLTPQGTFKRIPDRQKKFFLPVKALSKIIRGKFLSELDRMIQEEKLLLPDFLDWKSLKDRLYSKSWNTYCKETISANGNAVQYLGRYINRIAISNSRILSVSETEVLFSYTDYRTGQKKVQSLSPSKFVRMFLLHVLPKGFQKARYYGLLNNRMKTRNLQTVRRLQGCDTPVCRFSGMNKPEIIKELYGFDPRVCPVCHTFGMTPVSSKTRMDC